MNQQQTQYSNGRTSPISGNNRMINESSNYQSMSSMTSQVSRVQQNNEGQSSYLANGNQLIFYLKF